MQTRLSLPPHFFLPPVPDTTFEPLTGKSLHFGQMILGVKLPPLYLAALDEQNGGELRYNTHAAPPNNWSVDHVPVFNIRGIGEDRPMSLLQSPDTRKALGLPPKLILFSGSDSRWVALDYRAVGPKGDPSVAWVDADEGSITTLAPTFERFVAGLRDGNPHHVFGISGIGDNTARILPALNSLFDVRFAAGFDGLYRADGHVILPGSPFGHETLFLLTRNHLGGGMSVYPMFPDVEWVLSCDVPEAMADGLEERVRGYLRTTVTRVHTPRWKPLPTPSP